MKYCRHCGKQIEEDANICPFCSGNVSAQNNSAAASSKTWKKESVGVSKGLMVISALFPIAGIVIGVIKLGKDDEAAKKYLTISAISLGICLFITYI